MTNIAELLGDMNAGVYEEQINRAFSEVAANACACRKPGEITLTFKLKPIDDSNQVSISHKIKYLVPKQRGRVIEEHETATPFHVAQGGVITLYPNTQTAMELGAGAATGRTDGGR